MAVDKSSSTTGTTPVKPVVRSFCKTLTASDTSMHGGFSVLCRHADECLPPLSPPTQELVPKDLHGMDWRFCHIFRGQPRRHLLQSGWSVFVSSKRLVAGDAFIFLRGESGELRVGVRRAMRQMSNVPSSVISSHSMHLGVLATTWHAINTKSMFTVYYKPRTSPSEFIIPYDQYMESVKNNYSIGMRFEGEEAPEQRNDLIGRLERAAGSPPSSTGVDISSMMNMEDREIVELQRNAIKGKDEILDRMEETIASTNHIPLGINEELDIHTMLT
ncbi:hypothetical protein ACQ4PT_068507 [Festuca glaucescens]